jgi:hypothetical protein
MKRAAFIVCALLYVSNAAGADDAKNDQFRGSDGKFDASGYLATRGGFLPVPLIITDPAVGYGGGLGAVFFHGGNPLRREKQVAGARYVPPSVSAVMLFATENGSKGGVAAHFGVWKDDRIRYLGVAGGASLNLDYWGRPSVPLAEPLRYDVKGLLIFQRLLFRVADSPLFLGGEMSWSRQNAEFKTLFLPAGSPPRKLEQDDAGVGVVSQLDTLNNLFTPTRGMNLRVIGKVFSKSLSGDNDRQSADIEAFGYVPLNKKLTLGMRTEMLFSDGDTPFYLLPYLNMRGLPALKYSGKHTALGELEVRWNVMGRWSAVGFGGLGFVSDSIADLPDAESIGTIGGGFRYLVAEKLGIHVGVDLAKGPDDGAIYLVVGSAWR